MALLIPDIHIYIYDEMTDVFKNDDPKLTDFNIFLQQHKQKFRYGDIIRSQSDMYRNEGLFFWDGERAIVSYNNDSLTMDEEGYGDIPEPDEYGYVPKVFNGLEFDIWGRNNWWSEDEGVQHNFYFYTNLSSFYGELRDNLVIRGKHEETLVLSHFTHPKQGKIVILMEYEYNVNNCAYRRDVLKEEVLNCFNGNNFYSSVNQDLSESTQNYLNGFVDALHTKKIMYLPPHSLEASKNQDLELVVR